MSEIIEQELAADGKHTHCNVVALSGPTHAEEVARDMPTLIVAGSRMKPPHARYSRSLPPPPSACIPTPTAAAWSWAALSKM